MRIASSIRNTAVAFSLAWASAVFARISNSLILFSAASRRALSALATSSASLSLVRVSLIKSLSSSQLCFQFLNTPLLELKLLT